jgi:hypothetical protein
MGRYLEMLGSNTRPETPLCSPPDCEKSEITNNQGGAIPMRLRPCGELICRACGAISPSRHRADCAFPRFDPCRSHWFWLSIHRAVKCIGCSAPPDLSIVDAWVLCREDSIPLAILSLVQIAGPVQ